MPSFNLMSLSLFNFSSLSKASSITSFFFVSRSNSFPSHDQKAEETEKESEAQRALAQSIIDAADGSIEMAEALAQAKTQTIQQLENELLLETKKKDVILEVFQQRH